MTHNIYSCIYIHHVYVQKHIDKLNENLLQASALPLSTKRSLHGRATNRACYESQCLFAESEHMFLPAHARWCWPPAQAAAPTIFISSSANCCVDYSLLPTSRWRSNWVICVLSRSRTIVIEFSMHISCTSLHFLRANRSMRIRTFCVANG